MRFDGVPKNIAHKKAHALLEQVGLADRVDFKPSELSGGQRQRVAIARALINDPKILLADEPTGNLDQKSGEKVIEVLEKLNKKGITLIVITHDPGLAKRAKREVRIVDGRFVEGEDNSKNTKK